MTNKKEMTPKPSHPNIINKKLGLIINKPMEITKRLTKIINRFIILLTPIYIYLYFITQKVIKKTKDKNPKLT